MNNYNKQLFGGHLEQHYYPVSYQDLTKHYSSELNFKHDINCVILPTLLGISEANNEF